MRRSRESLRCARRRKVLLAKGTATVIHYLHLEAKALRADSEKKNVSMTRKESGMTGSNGRHNFSDRLVYAQDSRSPRRNETAVDVEWTPPGLPGLCTKPQQRKALNGISTTTTTRT